MPLHALLLAMFAQRKAASETDDDPEQRATTSDPQLICLTAHDKRSEQTP